MPYIFFYTLRANVVVSFKFYNYFIIISKHLASTQTIWINSKWWLTALWPTVTCSPNWSLALFFLVDLYVNFLKLFILILVGFFVPKKTSFPLSTFLQTSWNKYWVFGVKTAEETRRVSRWFSIKLLTETTRNWTCVGKFRINCSR